MPLVDLRRLAFVILSVSQALAGWQGLGFATTHEENPLCLT